MDLTLSESETAFRDELRLWLSTNTAGPEPVEGGEAHFSWRVRWQQRLASGGWAAVHWPVEYGGRGAKLTESAIFFEELARAGEPLPANVLGLLLAGPTLMTWGTREQQQRYLGPILTGKEIWCQGFSEPEAGSDLASVKTTAVPEGDDWVITGQKAWTSAAQYSKWCMLLARTDPAAPRKHQGLTYFLMNMQQPGVRVVPLRQITGEAHFNEVFLDGARVRQSEVLGVVGNGWQVALTTLMNERAGLAFFHQVRMRQLLDSLVSAAVDRGRLVDPAVAEALGELDARIEVLRLTGYRGLTTLERHGQPGPESAVAKLMWSGTNQALTQLAVDLLGPEVLTTNSRWAFELLRARANSIEGGTTEILKSIAAERVLGLPSSRH